MSLFFASSTTIRPCALRAQQRFESRRFQNGRIQAVADERAARRCVLGGKPNSLAALPSATSATLIVPLVVLKLQPVAGYVGDDLCARRAPVFDQLRHIAQRYRVAQIDHACHGRRARIDRNRNRRVAADALPAVDRAQQRVGRQLRIQIAALESGSICRRTRPCRPDSCRTAAPGRRSFAARLRCRNTVRIARRNRTADPATAIRRTNSGPAISHFRPRPAFAAPDRSACTSVCRSLSLLSVPATPTVWPRKSISMVDTASSVDSAAPRYWLLAWMLVAICPLRSNSRCKLIARSAAGASSLGSCIRLPVLI